MPVIKNRIFELDIVVSLSNNASKSAAQQYEGREIIIDSNNLEVLHRECHQHQANHSEVKARNADEKPD